jgi:hypothetical protein
MKLNTGLVRIPIERDGENVGELKFNPKDAGFAERFYSLISEFEEKEKEYREKAALLDADEEIDSFGVPKNAREGVALLKDICEYMREKIDYVFGESTSQLVFGDYNNPDMFEQFFEGVTPYIQQARTEKVAKYTKPKGKNVLK